MQPATAVLLMCGASLVRGELHNEHQTEVHIDALAKLAGCRLLADSLDYTLEFLVLFSALLVVHTLYLHYGGVY